MDYLEFNVFWKYNLNLYGEQKTRTLKKDLSGRRPFLSSFRHHHMNNKKTEKRSSENDT